MARDQDTRSEEISDRGGVGFKAVRIGTSGQMIVAAYEKLRLITAEMELLRELLECASYHAGEE